MMQNDFQINVLTGHIKNTIASLAVKKVLLQSALSSNLKMTINQGVTPEAYSQPLR